MVISRIPQLTACDTATVQPGSLFCLISAIVSSSILQMHLRHVIGYGELGLCTGNDVLHRDTGGRFEQRRTTTGESDHSQFGNNEIYGPSRSEWQSAFFDDFRLPLRRVLHRDDYAFGPRYEIHCPTHSGDHFARNHPIRELALLVHLQSAQNGHIDVTSADETNRPRAIA